MIRLFLILFLMAFSSGCSVYQIDSKETSQEFYPPKKGIDEVSYVEKVDKPFEQIGIVTVTTERRQTLEDVLPKLKQEAAILGGDIITDIQTNSTGSWQKMTALTWKKFNLHVLGNAYIRAQYSAKVLVLK